MNKLECINEKISSRAVGVIILPFCLFLAAIGFLVLPFFGLFFSFPVLLLSAVLMFGPGSRECEIFNQNI
jgi:hypothetical protein